jgi:hypothetical protein
MLCTGSRSAHEELIGKFERQWAVAWIRIETS